LKNIKEQIKENSLCGAYLIYGEEDFLKDFYTKKIASLCIGDGPAEFNMMKINNEKRRKMTNVRPAKKRRWVCVSSRCCWGKGIPSFLGRVYPIEV